MISRSLAERIVCFFFPRDSGNWIALLRVGMAGQVIGYCFSLRRDWSDVLASQGTGLIGRELSEIWATADSRLIPRISWLVSAGHAVGLSEAVVLSLAWSALLLAAIFLLLGLACRTSAVLTWFLHLCAVKSGGLLSYGVDDLTTIGLFYLMLCPLPDRFSLDRKWGWWPAPDLTLFGFYRRVLQLHLCLIYFFSGIAKCAGPGWWNGESLWRALTQPPFNTVPASLLYQGRVFLPLLGIFVCLLEVSYPVFIWGRTRRVWLIGMCAVHLMIGLTMRMYLFAGVMIVLNLAAFGTANGDEGVPNVDSVDDDDYCARPEKAELRG